MAFLMIGQSPSEEDCIEAQPGTDYKTAMRLEAERFKSQIERHYFPPSGAFLSVAWFDHGFGRYCEVVAHYSLDNDASVEWAFLVQDDELGKLKKWDL